MGRGKSLRDGSQKSKSNDKGRSRFPEGMTERKAKATAKAAKERQRQRQLKKGNGKADAVVRSR
jgi:hypothetical protein